MLNTVIFNGGDFSTHKKLVTLAHTVPMVIMHTMLNLVTTALLNVHWTSYNLTDILFRFNRKGMCGPMIYDMIYLNAIG
jgi:hypothetical protein